MYVVSFCLSKTKQLDQISSPPCRCIGSELVSSRQLIEGPQHSSTCNQQNDDHEIQCMHERRLGKRLEGSMSDDPLLTALLCYVSQPKRICRQAKLGW